jgi:predicted Zn-dependent peptidase
LLRLQDYLFSYRDRVQAVTAEDVLNAARRHLHPLEQQVVVVADAEVAKEQLMKQGRRIVPLELSDL